MEKKVVLIAEDESITALELQGRLKKLGYEVPAIALNGDEIIQLTGKYLPDLVLMDIGLAGKMDGIQAAEYIQKHYGSAVVYITGFTEADVMKRAMLSGAWGYISKPYNPRDLVNTMEMALYRREMERKLEESQQQFNLFMEHLPAAVFIKDRAGNIIYANKMFAQAAGKDLEEIMQQLPEEYTSEEVRETFKEENEEVFLRGKTIVSEHTYPGPLGLTHWTNIKFPIFQDGEAAYVGSISWDVTAKKEAEDALRESEIRQRNLLEAVSAAVIVQAADGEIRYANSRALALFEMSFEQLAGKTSDTTVWQMYAEGGEALSPSDNPSMITIRTGKPIYDCVRGFLLKETGKFLWLLISTEPIFDTTRMQLEEVVITFQDITPLKETKRELRTSLKEKEVLLREVHHRVKNNLQVIASMLSLQKEEIDDERVLKLLQDSQSRVYSMARIHEQLHSSEYLNRIDMEEYVMSLTSDLCQMYGEQEVNLMIDIENVWLDIDEAVPCALILNELITNALTHAFPNGRKGEIWVSLQQQEDQYELIVKDDGVGVSKDFESLSSNSLGLMLVDLLSKQLLGTYTLENGVGVKLKVVWPIEKN